MAGAGGWRQVCGELDCGERLFSVETYSGAMGGNGEGYKSAPRATLFQSACPEGHVSQLSSGVPDGNYAIVQFRSAFQNKAAATETVSLMLDNGKWKVAGYFIK
jgi:hypothetical protein